MKKSVALLLACVMCLGLCACGEKESVTQQEPEPEQKEIQLTVENIEEYLDINVDFINYYKGIKTVNLGGTSIPYPVEKEDVSLWVSPKQPGEFFEADIEIEVLLYNCWYVDVDVDDKTADADLEYSFRIPKNGEYTADNIRIDRDEDFEEYEGIRSEFEGVDDPRYVIKSVSGRFVKY